jgi:hypothetical protein
VHYNGGMGRAVGIIAVGIIIGLLIVWLVISQAPPSDPDPDLTGIQRPQVAPRTDR